jgi:signal transduction histidine kinase
MVSHLSNKSLIGMSVFRPSVTAGWVAFFFVCSCFVPQVLRAQSPLQSILILHSYNRGYQWTDDQNAGIESALKGAVNGNQIYVEYMDASRTVHDQDFHDLYLTYKEKYRGVKFDAICATDADALRFVRGYRDELFPGVPVVFSGITPTSDADMKGRQGFAGVRADPDVRANIEVILRIHPQTRLVVFINEWTANGKLLHDEFLRIMPLFKNRLSFKLLEDVDTKEVFDVISTLPRNAVILYGVFGRDKVGRTFDHQEILWLFSRNSEVPIYSPWDINLGYGVVGGVMSSGFSQGQAAGMQALQVLRGARAEYAQTTKSRNKYMFDYNWMKRFGISRNRLPSGSVMVNYPETLYEKHRKVIDTAIAVIVILLAIILMLLLNIRFRRKTEKELKTSRERLRALARRMVEVEDKARKDLSRELHDEVGQNMTVLGVNLNILRSSLPDVSSLVESRIGDSLAIVKQTTRRIRNVMGNLRSPVLDDYGLVAAVQFYGKQWADRTGISVHVKGSRVQPRLDPLSENALFRIVQESLNNVLKHANATEVTIAVRLTDGKLRLSVVDDGKGFDDRQIVEPVGEHGWGLTTMRERALAVGASFRIRSSAGAGTHIVVEVPI